MTFRNCESDHYSRAFFGEMEAGFVHATGIIRLSPGTANPRKYDLYQLG